MKNYKLMIVMVLATLLLSASSAFAQLERGSTLWTLNLGYAPLKSATTGNSLEGWTFNSTVEKLVGDGNWALGMNLAFFWSEDEILFTPGVKAGQSTSSIALYGTLKYLIDTPSNWTPYLGLGLGVHSSTRDFAIAGFFDIQDTDNLVVGTESLSSFALALPFGINYFPGSKTFVGLNVTPIWTEKSFYDTDVNWLLNFSLGFQFN
jgi:hypothetical protein